MKSGKIICIFSAAFINVLSVIAAMYDYFENLKEIQLLEKIEVINPLPPFQSSLEAAGCKMVFGLTNHTVATWIGEPTPFYYFGITERNNIIFVSKSGNITIPLVRYARSGVANAGRNNERVLIKSDIVSNVRLKWAIFSCVSNFICFIIYIFLNRRASGQ